MRLLITDPLHPVVQSTIARLKDRALEDGDTWTVLGLTTRAEAAHPPALDGLVTGPAPDDPVWGRCLLDLARRHRLDVVLPWTDVDARAASAHAAALAAVGTSVACPPARLVELACDKWATTLRLADAGIPVPESRLVRTAADVAAAATEMGYPRQPLLLKPRGLAGGHGVWSIRPGGDLTRTAPVPRLPLEAMVAAIATSDGRAEFLLQHELTGTDISVDVLAHDGRVIASAVRTRGRTLGGLCVQGTVLPGFPRLDQVVCEIVQVLGWSHLANIQLIADPGSGAVAVYEINARAAGSIGTSAHAGLDLLHAAIEYARSGEVPVVPATVPTPVGFRRFWTDQVWPL